MGTKKLTAFWRIIRCTDFFLVTTKAKDQVEAGVKILSEVQSGYRGYLNSLTNLAMEKGELHTLNALRNVVEEAIEKTEDSQNAGDK